MRDDEIKRHLNQAGRLVDEGKVADADEKIRAMVGYGLITRADISANLRQDQIKNLREYEKSNGV